MWPLIAYCAVLAKFLSTTRKKVNNYSIFLWRRKIVSHKFSFSPIFDTSSRVSKQIGQQIELVELIWLLTEVVGGFDSFLVGLLSEIFVQKIFNKHLRLKKLLINIK